MPSDLRWTSCYKPFFFPASFTQIRTNCSLYASPPLPQASVHLKSRYGNGRRTQQETDTSTHCSNIPHNIHTKYTHPESSARAPTAPSKPASLTSAWPCPQGTHCHQKQGLPTSRYSKLRLPVRERLCKGLNTEQSFVVLFQQFLVASQLL